MYVFIILGYLSFTCTDFKTDTDLTVYVCMCIRMYVLGQLRWYSIQILILRSEVQILTGITKPSILHYQKRV